MTTTTAPAWETMDGEAWLNATAQLRKDIIEERYPIHLAAIDEERKGKVKKENRITETQRKQARHLASADAREVLYNLPSYNGIWNPSHHDPIWGVNAKPEEVKAPSVKANKYGGKCVRCGAWIEAEAGALVKTPDGKWGVDHIGDCPAQQAQEASKVDGLDLSGLRSGYYAVPDGDTRLKVAISQGKNKWEGFTFVKDAAEYGSQKRYGMQRPGQPYRGDIEAELAIILADPKAAMVAYGKLVGKCGACGRQLEDESSVAAGIGPICAQGW